MHVWEVADDDEVIHNVASYKSDDAQRGFSFLPKKFTCPDAGEIMRAVRLTDKKCEYVSFRLPNANKMEVMPEHSETPRLHNGSFPDPASAGDGPSAPQAVSTPATAPVSVAAPTPAPATGVSEDEVETIKKEYEETISGLRSDLQQSQDDAERLSGEVSALTTERDDLKTRLASLKQELQDAKAAASAPAQAEPAQADPEPVADEPAQADPEPVAEEPAQADPEPVAEEPAQSDPEPSTDNDGTNTQDLLAELEDEQNKDDSFD